MEDDNMKFDVFTMVRNKNLDWLLFEFRSRVILDEALKRNFPGLGSETRTKMAKRSAEHWNKIAKILLSLDEYENEDEVISKCFEVLGKDCEEKPVGLKARTLKRKEKESEEFFNGIVSYKSFSTDENFAVCYLKKMYEYLEMSAHPFVDFKLKNEMLERLKSLENI